VTSWFVLCDFVIAFVFSGALSVLSVFGILGRLFI